MMPQTTEMADKLDVLDRGSDGEQRSQPDVTAQSSKVSPLDVLKTDLPAGLVVFLVALPLCLGIALASGAPLFSGLIAGIVGGLVIPLISRAPLSVSGPAAGLAAIVFTGISALGSFSVFALAVVIAGVMQLVLGVLRAGGIAHYFPSSVIKGMLTAIGVLLILKQLPHAIGLDVEEFGAMSFQVGKENTFSLIARALEVIQPGAAIISVGCVALLVFWDKVPALKKLTWLPGPLVAVLGGTLANELFQRNYQTVALQSEHLVRLPSTDGAGGLLGALHLPDWSAITRADVWTLAVTLAVVASLETLLNLEAVDRIDPWRRKSPPNREMLAQGMGNLTSGLLGGLPITSVVVRSSAGVNAGGRTKAVALFHGLFLMLAVLFMAPLLTRIPLACLAAILLTTGYKLAKPKLFSDMYRLGWSQFTPFMVTVLAIVLTDLLKGVAIGLAVGLAFVLRESMSRVYEVSREGQLVTIRLNKEAFFFSRGKLVSLFEELPRDTHVILDAEAAPFVDHDVADAIRDFQSSAGLRNIQVEVRGLKLAPVAPG
ncbi:SulP family inorganic anion transporter [Chondromyces crocatus]|uniref:Membrane protein n=1 Tax=Chondromyces crocatus TaxID=52 RepID=A0A0K1E614_CHOCO|nr:SulP family inorganic anion transporter [Chondromyces crocatus]AKT36315.1 membrane protein [Chondromyces crocatus]